MVTTGTGCQPLAYAVSWVSETVRVLPEWRLDDLMILFGTWGGIGHNDNYDVFFIIPEIGRRRWRVGDALPMRRFCPHPALLHVDPFEPIIDVEMAPGDILYIPPGFLHDGFTFEDTMNYSVGFRGPNGRDLLMFCRLRTGARSGRDKLVRILTWLYAKNAGRMEAHEVERLRAMMIEMINKPGDFEQWLGRFATTPRHELDIAPLNRHISQKKYWMHWMMVKNWSDWADCESYDWRFLCEYRGTTKETKEQMHCANLRKLEQMNCEALMNSAFVAELTEFINQGYWYFDE